MSVAQKAPPSARVTNLTLIATSGGTDIEFFGLPCKLRPIGWESGVLNGGSQHTESDDESTDCGGEIATIPAHLGN